MPKINSPAKLSRDRVKKKEVVRIGLKEMQTFITHFYPKTKTEVFAESCGVADLITTCFGGLPAFSQPRTDLAVGASHILAKFGQFLV